MPVLSLRLRGGGGNDRIPGQDEEKEYTFTGRTRAPKRIVHDGKLARQTPFWICSECGNMLMPKEDPAEKRLMRYCRNCTKLDKADNNLVFVNDLRPNAMTQDVGSDVTKDPTLPRAATECTNCGHDESVFFQAQTRGDDGMKLVFMCTSCAYRWIQ